MLKFNKNEQKRSDLKGKILEYFTKTSQTRPATKNYDEKLLKTGAF